MKRLLLSALLALLFLSMPALAKAAQELHAIKEKEPTKTMYERAVVFFTQKIPESFRERLINSSKYIDMVTAIFSEKGIPTDIAYLPLIESGFSPLSVSPRGAVGLWQFVRATAQRYGLRIDNYVDERKDPVKSTHAAADYLRDLYSMFGAWDVALAAYHAGEGRIRSTPNIYQAKGIPSVIKLYVPYFMAAFTIAEDPERYGFDADEDMTDAQSDHREIVTNEPVSLKVLARKYNTTVSELKELNPALLTDKTPPYRYTIRVPI